MLVLLDRLGAEVPLDNGTLFNHQVVRLEAFVLNLDGILLGFWKLHIIWSGGHNSRSEMWSLVLNRVIVAGLLYLIVVLSHVEFRLRLHRVALKVRHFLLTWLGLWRLHQFELRILHAVTLLLAPCLRWHKCACGRFHYLCQASRGDVDGSRGRG